ncbi:MAG: hypothetical protein PWR24_203 [Desulfonauticus sp.]|jgi:cardiolipin synthase|nr:hypothetical protein [Desulfonauticus sp.]
MNKNLTIPNILTVFRILLTPVFVIFFLDKEYAWSLGVFFLAGFTDGLDGFIARFFRQKSKLGALLDPLADKVLLITTYVCLGIARWVPGWLAVLVVSRDLLILGGVGLLSFLGFAIKDNIRPSFVSKVNTLLQILLVVLILGAKSSFWVLKIELGYFYALVGLFTLLSGINYVFQGINYLSLVNNNSKNEYNR